ncbi:MAG: ribonuclease HII [Caldimonas sp.]
MHARTFLRADKLRRIVDVVGFMAGVDEVGRGPLAGPVVAAAVILDERRSIRGLNDSKLLSAEERERLDIEIRAKAVCFCIAEASVGEIDTINILRAALLAMRRAVEGLAQQPQIVLVDGNQRPELSMAVRTVVGGDAKVRAISAASIIAKVHRDRICMRLHDEHPQYGFDSHKGYSTPEHLSALREHGACAQHRRSFAPVRDALDRLF